MTHEHPKYFPHRDSDGFGRRREALFTYILASVAKIFLIIGRVLAKCVTLEPIFNYHHQNLRAVV